MQEVFQSLAVKASSMDAMILSLSGGNQQKVVMSRALLSQPGFIIADEPTAHLDSKLAEELLTILQRLKTDGKTIIIATSSGNKPIEGTDAVIGLNIYRKR